MERCDCKRDYYSNRRHCLLVGHGQAGREVPAQNQGAGCELLYRLGACKEQPRTADTGKKGNIGREATAVHVGGVQCQAQAIPPVVLGRDDAGLGFASAHPSQRYHAQLGGADDVGVHVGYLVRVGPLRESRCCTG